MAGNGKKTGDYEVGYGKPPASGKFKPGTSGNPGGKKKGKSLAHYLAEAGDSERTFNLGGQQVTLPANDALAHRLYTDALKGKHPAARIVLDAQKSVLGEKPPGEGILAGSEELEVARTHVDWLKLIADAEGDHTDDDATG